MVWVIYHPGAFPSDTPGSTFRSFLNRNQTLQLGRSTEPGLGTLVVHEHKTQIALNHLIIISVMFPITLAAGACSALGQFLCVFQLQASVRISLIVRVHLFTYNCNTFMVLVLTLKV